MKLENIILASGSPRREELLRQIGMVPTICKSSVEEVVTSESPEEVVMELSSQKAEQVASSSPLRSLILGADTVVAIDGMILGKPKSHQEAYEMILRLQGRTHQVYTGVTLLIREADGNCGISFYEKTDVTLFAMTEEEITVYADSEEPMDKAGAYAIQGTFAAYVRGIHGDYSNVVGLPVGRVYQELKQMLENEEEEDLD